MTKKILLWQVAGFIFTCILGTLLHFLYEWTGENFFVGFISGVNESTWEHMKLLFMPLFLFTIVQRFAFKGSVPQLMCIKLIGTLVGLLLIPVLYYTYTGVIGQNIDAVNISIFYICAAVTFITETLILTKHRKCCLSDFAAMCVLIFILFLFVLFTYMPLQLNLFVDPTVKND